MNRQIIFENHFRNPVKDYTFSLLDEALQDTMLDFSCIYKTPGIAKDLKIDSEETSKRLLKLIERWSKRKPKK